MKINTTSKYATKLLQDATNMKERMDNGELEGSLQYKPEFEGHFGSICQWNVEEGEAINLCLKMLNRRRFGKNRVPFADWFFYNRVMVVLNRTAKV